MLVQTPSQNLGQWGNSTASEQSIKSAEKDFRSLQSRKKHEIKTQTRRVGVKTSTQLNTQSTDINSEYKICTQSSNHVFDWLFLYIFSFCNV